MPERHGGWRGECVGLWQGGASHLCQAEALSPPRAFDAVLFDLDGTLLDTVPDLATAANHMLAELGRPVLSEAIIATYVGRGITRLIERVLTGQMDGKSPVDALAAAQAVFERHYVVESGIRSRPYAGVLQGLEQLRMAGLPMGVVTNKSGRFTLDLLRKTGLSGYFGVVVSGDTLPVKKPDPAPVLHACATLGALPSRVLFIGDSRHDVAAGRSAGCVVWCVPYGYNEGQPVEALGGDRLVDGVDSAASLILAASLS